MMTNRQLDEFKASLRQCEEMDRFEMLDKLRLFRVTELAKDDDQYIRLLLKKTLIEEILKDEDSGTLRFELEAIKGLLQCKSKGFGCCFLGCRFEAYRHRDYIKHLKLVHTPAQLS